MRFFYKAVLEVNRANADVLDSDAESTETSGTEGEEGTTPGDGNPDEADNGRIKGTVWLSCVKAVSDLTKYDWEKVFRMSAMEFFVFLKFNNYLVLKEERKMKQIMKKK